MDCTLDMSEVKELFSTWCWDRCVLFWPPGLLYLQYLDRSQIAWNFWQDRKVLFEGLEAITLPETNIAPETLGVGRWVSLWEGLLTGAMLVFGSVYALIPMFFVVAYLATWLTTKWTKGKFRAKWKTVATTEFRGTTIFGFVHQISIGNAPNI